jgi:hypothetical protein
MRLLKLNLNRTGGAQLKDSRGFMILDLMTAMPIVLITMSAVIGYFLFSLGYFHRYQGQLDAKRDLADAALSLRDTSLCKQNFQDMHSTGAAELSLASISLSSDPASDYKIELNGKLGSLTVQDIRLKRFVGNPSLAFLEVRGIDTNHNRDDTLKQALFMTYNDDGTLAKCSTKLIFESGSTCSF